MFKNLRFSLAFKFGAIEHAASRFLFVLLVITLVFHIYEYYLYVRYFLIADLIVWIVYWVAHSLEKAIIPKR